MLLMYGGKGPSWEQKHRMLQKHKIKDYFDFSRRLVTVELHQFLLRKTIPLVVFRALDCATVGTETHLKHFPVFGFLERDIKLHH